MTERTADEIKQAVLERYSATARGQLEKEAEIPLAAAEGDACCEPSCCGPTETAKEETSAWAEGLYSAKELGTVPADVAQLSLGCGNPTALAELRPGEAVLDLGSGSGLDCFLAAQQVGSEGRVVGLDMSDDMLELAQRNLTKVGATNVEFRKGELESMPLPDDSFDAIISNCVINLSPDKDAVFRESLRVLKPGGRLRVSDIVWTRKPTDAEQSDLASWTGCIAGALEVGEYVSKLEAAGFVDVTTKLKEETGERGFGSADISASKPQSSECC